MNTNEFLKLLHGDSKINFRVIKGKLSINKNDTYENLENELHKLNEEGYNIYFQINSGGTHINEITKINAVFIDFDCGKDENKQYYPLEKTKKFKQECIDKVGTFKYQPSFIIETRNGIHVYWLLNQDATNDEYLQCQLQLISYFNSDPAVKDLTRIMRLPNFYWMKDINNKFMCNILKYNGTRYNITDIIKELPLLEIVNKEKPKHDKKIKQGIIVKPVINKINNIQLIKNRDTEGLKSVLNGNIEARGKVPTIDNNNILSSIVGTTLDSPIIVTNRSELYDVINKIDLVKFLGLNNTKFSCIFHEDNNPSANIFINNETGHYVYKCYSSKCKAFSGTIIRIVEKLQKCSKPQAINFIKQVYNIQLIESDWQKEQKEILQLNKDYLYSGLMETEFPELYKRIRNYIPILIMLNDIAMNNVFDESISEDDKVIFFSSIRYISKLLNNMDLKRLSERVNLFVFFELINKLTENQIPEKLLVEAKHQAALKKQNKLVSFYSIPSYSDDILSKAEDNAILFKEKNMSMKGWSRELLVRTFGENSEIVNRVFPQDKDKKLSKKSNDFSVNFSIIIINLINERGYATEKEVLEILQGYKELNKVKIKRVLQETIDGYNLKRTRANKIIKEKYKINSDGYPFIIVKDEE